MPSHLLLSATGATLLLLLAATTVAARDHEQDALLSVRCESHDGRTEQCPIDGHARLLRQLSVTRCVEDDNWGQGRGTVWVSDGCRAEFIGEERDRHRWPRRGRDGQRLLCESQQHKEKQCPIRVRYEVRMVKQKSIASCIEDQNWGWDRRGVWVSDGCRAEFRVY